MDIDSDKQDEKERETADPKPPAAEAADEKPTSGDEEPGEESTSEDEGSRADAGTPTTEGAPKPKKKKKKKAATTKTEAPAPAAKTPPSTALLVVGGLVIAGLVGGGVYLLRRQGGSHGKWRVGDEVDVELTVLAADAKNLACASAEEVSGRHCAFEAQSKPWSKGGDAADDKRILKPYTTTDRVQLTAAGLWSDPALTGGKLPPTRFSVKCKYKVEGNLAKPSVRWQATGGTTRPATGTPASCRAAASSTLRAVHGSGSSSVLQPLPGAP